MFDNFEEDFLTTKDDFTIWYGHNLNSPNTNHKLPTIFFNYGLVCSVSHFDFQIVVCVRFVVYPSIRLYIRANSQLVRIT